MQTFADLASLALQRVRTQNDHEELLLLQDRQRISRDLHDHVLQHMFGISLRLKAPKRYRSSSRMPREPFPFCRDGRAGTGGRFGQAVEERHNVVT
ncbi:histidine kinase [Actinopolymorpha rutila]|uniref:Signal transduction histidine kinase subgroup 3 dimerisation and phosphoacceptor domain-containing protein n=1 Tax=Actinopolymorpha rutila TaxID=446787 RepID=A0A852ZDA6_9ACTN|nr:hypothetical protein [Actinopolymorpha rutila]